METPIENHDDVPSEPGDYSLGFRDDAPLIDRARTVARDHDGITALARAGRSVDAAHHEATVGLAVVVATAAQATRQEPLQVIGPADLGFDRSRPST